MIKENMTTVNTYVYYLQLSTLLMALSTVPLLNYTIFLISEQNIGFVLLSSSLIFIVPTIIVLRVVVIIFATIKFNVHEFAPQIINSVVIYTVLGNIFSEKKIDPAGWTIFMLTIEILIDVGFISAIIYRFCVEYKISKIDDKDKSQTL